MATIKTKDGIYLDIGDLAPDAPEVREAVMAERSGRMRRRMESPEMQAKLQANLAKDRETYDPTVGMSGLDKVLPNVGAGIANTWEGFKQIMPGMKGASDEDLLEKRAIDKHLAEKTDAGVGADWMPSAGSALQFAGEVAPTLAIPGGAAGGAALRTASMAGKVLPRSLATLLRTSPVLSGAAGGAAVGALQPVTSDESRTVNTVLGGATGAALPLAIKGVRSVAANWGAPRRAAQALSQGLGEQAETIPGQVAARDAARATTSRAARDIPESLAEATGSIPAADLEAQSAREVPNWADFKRGQNVARHEAVQQATNEADMLTAREGSRDLTADPLRDAAMQAAGATPAKQVMAPTLQAVNAISTSPGAVNPSVRRVVDLVRGAMDPRSPGGGRPESLYEVRKLLASKLNGPAQIGDELSAAVKGADRQTMQLIQAIDQSLDQASGGQWGQYLEAYKGGSRGVDASKASQLVRDTFEREGIPELGGAPEVTATRLGQAMRASEGSAGRAFPLALSDRARGGLGDVAEHLKQANEVQKARKLAGTAGGGSQTSFDLNQIMHRALPQLGGLPVRALRATLDAVSKGGHVETQRELAVLLQNPQAAVRAIQEAQRLNQPLSAGQAALWQAITQSAGSAPGEVLQAQPQAR
jgi:hypothetical protein